MEVSGVIAGSHCNHGKTVHSTTSEVLSDWLADEIEQYFNTVMASLLERLLQNHSINGIAFNVAKKVWKVYLSSILTTIIRRTFFMITFI